ncbi:4-methylmuconolactone methylisomerase [Cupriavidus taiwanensis]|uniref:4-methylmuconolactone methylisomerase MmlI n=1 Tax=Cupriavidus taiwanensis TaxID=164546 RepID=A0A375J6J7_9BURK|nr:4-methylmuconolactone methylisomerase [Cupriavidus taiwanensis]SPS00479.1 4-methylmuconolactone methylisomerase MmlI [Cupriavidus taiwanensis]
MIRLLYLLVKPEGMSDETFRAECLRHDEMSRDVPGLHKYEVRLVAAQPTDTHVPYFDIGHVDAIGECWFESEAGYATYLASDVRKAWFEHGKTFIGRLKPFRTAPVTGDASAG